MAGHERWPPLDDNSAKLKKTVQSEGRGLLPCVN